MTESQGFDWIYLSYGNYLLYGAPKVDVGTWHAMDVSGNKLAVTREVSNASFSMEVPDSIGALKDFIKPNLPWAEEHFQERVSGIPYNPPPSHVRWPWSHANAQHQKQEKFSHTYPERFWPRRAGPQQEMYGIRGRYGDLEDLVQHMIQQPYTRQAYLPVWFPEDLGVVGQERVPCTLGYHFLTRPPNLRSNQGDYIRTQVTYYIRSCDLIRHFRDDVYMAARLLQWVCERIHTKPGMLHFQCVSLHILEGDVAKLTKEVEALAASNEG